MVGVFKDDKLILGPYWGLALLPVAIAGFEQITKDHSLLQEQIDAGLITPEQAVNPHIKIPSHPRPGVDGRFYST